jgi:hypothetical protein
LECRRQGCLFFFFLSVNIVGIAAAEAHWKAVEAAGAASEEARRLARQRELEADEALERRSVSARSVSLLSFCRNIATPKLARCAN